MVEEKEQEKKNKEEEQAADDSAEETPKKTVLFGKVKKYIIPASAALAAFAVSVVLYIFVLRDGFEPKGEISEGDSSQTQVADSELPSQVDSQTGKPATTGGDKSSQLSVAGLESLEIDTAEIMKELDFLFITPDMERSGLMLTPEDSVDTLNWLQKEMARLGEEKESIDQRRKELERLEKKINQGLIRIQQAESDRAVKLARLYNGMKGNEVAKVFANLDDALIVDILPRMKSSNAAKILGLLPPKRAARISTQMVKVLEN